MKPIISHSKSGIITSSKFPLLVGKRYRDVYAKAINRYELELMYVFDVYSVQHEKKTDIYIFRNSKYYLAFVRYKDKIYIDNLHCISDLYHLRKMPRVPICADMYLSIISNLNTYTYFRDTISELIIKRRKFYNYGDPVEYRKDDYLTCFAVMKPDYYLNDNIRILDFQINPSDKYIYKEFGYLYNNFNVDKESHVSYKKYKEFALMYEPRIIPKGTVIMANDYIYPICDNLNVVYIPSRPNNIRLSHIDMCLNKTTYELYTNYLTPAYSDQLKLFMVRYRYENGICYMLPPYANSKWKIGYIYGSRLHNPTDSTNIMIHNYRFNICQVPKFTDIKLIL